MKNRYVALFVLLSVGAFSQPALADDPDEGVFGAYLPWISRIEFRLATASEGVSINNLPDQVRQVTEYNRGIPHTLPSPAKGSTMADSFGFGFSFSKLNWLEFSLDLVLHTNSYSGGRTTWNEIGFPSDDYLGYEFHGYSIDPGIKIVPYAIHTSDGFEFFQVYGKAGIQKHYFTLASGTDAWSAFTAQNSLPIDGYSYTVGAGFAVYIVYFEYLRSVSFGGYPKTSTDRYIVGLNVSIVNLKGCLANFIGCMSYIGAPKP